MNLNKYIKFQVVYTFIQAIYSHIDNFPTKSYSDSDFRQFPQISPKFCPPDFQEAYQRPSEPSPSY